MMRAAEHAEGVDVRLQLAKQATLELVAAYAMTQPIEIRAVDRAGLSLLKTISGVRRHRPAIEFLKNAQPIGPGPVDPFEALARLFAWLERHIDTQTARDILVARWLRHSGLATFLLLVTGYLWAPSNVARNQSVTASSLCSLTPDSPIGKAPLYRVVDGRRGETRFALCTAIESRPWVTVDLGRPRQVERVAVFPRNDCCYGDLELPVSIELSNDNTHFESIGSINSPATPDTPWKFCAPPHSTARYVRMTTATDEPRQIVIGEIEVYGR